MAIGGFALLKAALKTEQPLMVVVSQSMVPTLGVGDFILVGRVENFSSVKAAPPPEGEVLVFTRIGDPDDYIVHRAVVKSFERGRWRFTTQGDNNQYEDPMPVSEERIVGRVVGSIPLLGYLPIFVKSVKGFLLVASVIAVVFVADYVLPARRGGGGGRPRLPFRLPLLPLLVMPLALVAIWASPSQRLEFEFLALAFWYLGSLISPLALGHDDLCLMLWLYDLVIFVIPIVSDIVRWMTGITPSMWWYLRGSTVPVRWLVTGETPMFIQIYSMTLLLLLPGCAIFLSAMALRRLGLVPTRSVDPVSLGEPPAKPL